MSEYFGQPLVHSDHSFEVLGMRTLLPDGGSGVMDIHLMRVGKESVFDSPYVSKTGIILVNETFPFNLKAESKGEYKAGVFQESMTVTLPCDAIGSRVDHVDNVKLRLANEEFNFEGDGLIAFKVLAWRATHQAAFRPTATEEYLLSPEAAALVDKLSVAKRAQSDARRAASSRARDLPAFQSLQLQRVPIEQRLERPSVTPTNQKFLRDQIESIGVDEKRFIDNAVEHDAGVIEAQKSVQSISDEIAKRMSH